MAWREALRDFYSRIAGRLQAADSQAPGASWVAVRVAGQGCLLPLHQSGEIFPAAALQRLPYTRPWFLGVANLRGELFSVVDLGAYLQASKADDPAQRPALPGDGAAPEPQRPVRASEPAGVLVAPAVDAGWFVTLHPSLQARSALRVEGLEGLRSPADLGPALSADDSPPALAPWVSQVHADASGATWFVLDLHRIASQPGFLHVHA